MWDLDSHIELFGGAAPCLALKMQPVGVKFQNTHIQWNLGLRPTKNTFSWRFSRWMSGTSGMKS